MTGIIFETNCTVPHAKVNYFSSPPVRGTLDILWSCLGILILCTWSIQHLNVPLQSRPHRKWQAFRRKAYSFGKKMKWMLVSLIAPEYTLGKAIADLCSAIHYHGFMKEKFPNDVVEWTLSHAFFADMGGFVIRFPASLPEKDIECRCKICKLSADTLLSIPASLPVQGSMLESEPGLPLPLQVDLGDIPLAPLPEPSTQIRDNTRWNPPAARADENITPPTSGQTPRQESAVDPSSPPPPLKRPTRKHTGFTDRTQTHAPFLHNACNSDIAKQFGKWQNNPKLSLDGFLEANNDNKKAFGEMTWKQCPHNRKIAEHIQLEGVEPNEVPDAEYLAFFTNVTVLQGDEWIVDAAQLHVAREVGLLESLPIIKEDEIDDKNKGDFLVKTVAIIQVCWLVTQLTIRAFRHLPASQLEVVALAFAVCSIITFSLLYCKPQDCKTPVYVDAVRRPTVDEFKQIAKTGPINILGLVRCRNWMPNNVIHANGLSWSPMTVVALGNAFGATVFGLLHCLAWNAPFPTKVEQKLWHAACIVATCVPATGIIAHWIYTSAMKGIGKQDSDCLAKVLSRESARNAQKKERERIWTVHRWCSFIGLTFFFSLYFIARLYITVEIFRALCFLPPEAFVSTWASNVPHIN